MTISYAEAYDKAEAIYQAIKGQPYSKAIKVVDFNEGNPEHTDNEMYRFIWAVVRIKINNNHKRKLSEVLV